MERTTQIPLGPGLVHHPEGWMWKLEPFIPVEGPSRAEMRCIRDYQLNTPQGLKCGP
jgi:hypothetical protein